MGVGLRLIPAVAAGFLPLLAVASFSPRIAADVDLSASSLGVVTALFFATSAVTAGTLGPWISKLVGAAQSLRWSLVGVGLLLAAIGAARNALHLGALLACCGLLNGTIQPASNQVVADQVRDNRTGLTIGMKQAAIPLAGLLAGVSLPVLLPHFGWRGSVVILGCVCIALAAPSGRRQGAPAPRSTGAGGQMPWRSLLPFAIAGLFGNMASNSLATFYVPSVVEHGASPELAGVLLLAGSSTSILGRVGWGFLGDRRPSIEVSMASMLLAAGALAIAALAVEAGTVWIVLATAVAFAAGWGWTGVVVSSIVRAHPSIATSATGFVMAGGLIGGVIGPLWFGYTADVVSYGWAWLAAGSCMLIAALTMRVATVGYPSRVRD